MMRQIRSGVAGIDTSVTWYEESASTIALMIAAGAPTFPGSLPPFTPSGFSFVGTGRVLLTMGGMLSARGIA